MRFSLLAKTVIDNRRRQRDPKPLPLQPDKQLKSYISVSLSFLLIRKAEMLSFFTTAWHFTLMHSLCQSGSIKHTYPPYPHNPITLTHDNQKKKYHFRNTGPAFFVTITIPLLQFHNSHSPADETLVNLNGLKPPLKHISSIFRHFSHPYLLSI